MIPTPLDRPPTFEEIRNDLGQISDYLLQGGPIRAQAKPDEFMELERLNQVLNCLHAPPDRCHRTLFHRPLGCNSCRRTR